MLALLFSLLIAARAADPDPADEPVETAVPPAPDSDEGTPEEAPVRSFEDLAARAKETYFQGDHEAALALYDDLWQRVLAGEHASMAALADLAIYRGEVQYQLRQRTEAWNTFAWLLRKDPDVPISPIMHPQEVVHWFELVRKRVRQELTEQSELVPDPPPPRPPLPLWGYLPLGTPQFAQKRVGAGLAWGGAQLAMAGVSIGTWIYLGQVNDAAHPPSWADDDVTRQVNLRRYLIQWPATFAFYGLWAGSHFAARRDWRRAHEVRVTVELGDRTGLQISGRF